MAKNLLVLNGPNLNLLGEREVEIYGGEKLSDINDQMKSLALEYGFNLETEQTNHEGTLIDAVQKARKWADGIIINPGGYTHTSVALCDAVAAISIPVIEVHISNIYTREEFRHKSLLAPVVWGQISGLGSVGYLVAVTAFKLHWDKELKGN